MLTEQNWNYSYYQLQHYKALISLAARPCQQDPEGVIQFYTVGLYDEEFKEITPAEEFLELSDAVQYVRRKYGQWPFIDQLEVNAQKSKGGCSSCSAH